MHATKQKIQTFFQKISTSELQRKKIESPCIYFAGKYENYIHFSKKEVNHVFGDWYIFAVR